MNLLAAAALGFVIGTTVRAFGGSVWLAVALSGLAYVALTTILDEEH